MNSLQSHFVNVVSVSLCLLRRSRAKPDRGAFALLPHRSPRRSAVATALLATVLVGICPNLANAQLANINPIKDNTLYQYDPVEGDVSNALGQHFFAGETGLGELRRGVLAFAIAGIVPAGSTLLGVTLSLNMSRAPSGTPRTVELHRLSADWGEGTSVAPGEEGEGAPATTNDATWRHRFF